MNRRRVTFKTKYGKITFLKPKPEIRKGKRSGEQYSPACKDSNPSEEGKSRKGNCLPRTSPEKPERPMNVRVFDCGHERQENIAYMTNRPYQKVGDIGYCRECWQDRKIIRTYKIKLTQNEKEFLKLSKPSKKEKVNYERQRPQGKRNKAEDQKA